MTPHHTLHISGTVLLSAVLCLLLVTGISWQIARKRKKSDRGQTEGPDWSVPTIDRYADRRSFFHQWDPRLKLVSLFVYCFLVVSLHTLFWSGIAFVISTLALLTCNIPLARAGKRLLAMLGFLSMFLLIVPFTSPLRPDETLVYFPGLSGFPFHMAGFSLALAIVVKACAIALMMEPLFGTAPLAVTLQGMSRLGLPSAIGQMVLLSHRYIFVFVGEMRRMYRGMRVRGFVPATNVATMKTMGNFLGMLFVRSFDRTQRVYDAMLSRGYNGQFPSFIHFATTGKDWAKGLLWLTLGLLLLLADLRYGNPLGR
ncbi:MAG: cobalt ECF transporter T component CbiQ [Desulfopila sp.]